MKFTVAIVALAASTVGGCAIEGDPPDGAQLLVPDDVELHWDQTFNGIQDGIGALVPVDVMVYDGATGDPLQFVSFEMSGDGVQFVVDEQILFQPEECGDDCIWDAFRDQFVTFDTDYATIDASLAVTTDEDGLARVYVLVDAFPVDDGVFSEVPVHAILDVVEESFLLIPQ